MQNSETLRMDAILFIEILRLTTQKLKRGIFIVQKSDHWTRMSKKWSRNEVHHVTHHVIPCISLVRQNFKKLPEQIFYRPIWGPYHRVIDHLSLFEGRPVRGICRPRTHCPEFVSCICSKALIIGFCQSSFDGCWNSRHFRVFVLWKIRPFLTDFRDSPTWCRSEPDSITTSRTLPYLIPGPDTSTVFTGVVSDEFIAETPNKSMHPL